VAVALDPAPGLVMAVAAVAAALDPAPGLAMAEVVAAALGPEEAADQAVNCCLHLLPPALRQP